MGWLRGAFLVIIAQSSPIGTILFSTKIKNRSHSYVFFSFLCGFWPVTLQNGLIMVPKREPCPLALPVTLTEEEYAIKLGRLKTAPGPL